MAGKTDISGCGSGRKILLLSCRLQMTESGLPVMNRRKFSAAFTRRMLPAVAKVPGLGLAMVYEIARFYHGTVTVESVVDQGSTFVVRMPAGQS